MNEQTNSLLYILITLKVIEPESPKITLRKYKDYITIYRINYNNFVLFCNSTLYFNV